MSLQCNRLTVSVNGRTLVRDLNLDLEAGQFTCVLGPNGVGKTLTLHTLAGIRPLDTGEIRLHGDSIHAMDRRTVARRLGLLLQTQDDAFPTTVMETALMGCFARTGFWRWENRSDWELARVTLRAMDLDGMGARLAVTLSGGERRRLAIATLLVQNPDIFLLDEPLNHLDPLHKLTVLNRLKVLATSGKTIVATLHDPTLAARSADSILLLHGDGNWQYGSVSQLLTARNLEKLYGTRFAQFDSGEESVLIPVAPMDGSST